MAETTEPSSLDRVRCLVADVLDLTPPEVPDDMRMHGHPQWDSLAQLDIILKLEAAFGLTVDDAIAAKLTTVAEMARHMGSAR